jgi:uncharacterized membrane protein YbaN (DUF454 family)
MKGASWKRHLYLLAGFITCGLGMLGAVLPLLPATPFLLLAAFCFVRSSPRWYDWLINHRIFGPYILAFRERRGLTPQQKWRIAAAVTITLMITALLSSLWIGRALAGFIWVTGMVALYFSPTAKPLPAYEEAKAAAINSRRS